MSFRIVCDRCDATIPGASFLSPASVTLQGHQKGVDHYRGTEKQPTPLDAPAKWELCDACEAVVMPAIRAILEVDGG